MAEKKANVTEWNLDGALDVIANIHKDMEDRSFAFILGAGASVTSGIPSGGTLAKRWLEELHKLECRDGGEIEDWVKSGALGIDDLTMDRAAEFYPQIFDRRFGKDPDVGSAALEKAMEGKEPSFGYSLLAEVIQKTRHRVVVTTNFDNLVADALAIHAHRSPLVVAHESLAGYVGPNLRRPLIAKIHRDLFFDPINDAAGVGELEAGWQEALGKLFHNYTPLVIGYGGNDGSLMGFLDKLENAETPGHMIWCYYENSRPPENVLKVIEKHDGVIVAIPGFDEFMLELCGKIIKDFDVTEISRQTEKLGKERVERYRKEVEELTSRTATSTPTQQRTSAALAASAKDETDWWTWELRARAENDPEKKRAVYEAGIRQIPDSSKLHGSFAKFFALGRKDFDATKALYQKALKLDPESVGATGNYATFLSGNRQYLDEAEAVFKKALKLDPEHVNITASYGAFLADGREDLDAAEAMYNMGLKLDPENAVITANYAALELARDEANDIESARTHATRALDFSRSDPGHPAASALLYLCLCAELLEGCAMPEMARLKRYLHTGFDRGISNYSIVFRSILPQIQEDRRELYEALGAAIQDSELVPALDKFDEWKALEPIDPFEPL